MGLKIRFALFILYILSFSAHAEVPCPLPQKIIFNTKEFKWQLNIASMANNWEITGPRKPGTLHFDSANWVKNIAVDNGPLSGKMSCKYKLVDTDYYVILVRTSAIPTHKDYWISSGSSSMKEGVPTFLTCRETNVASECY